MTDIREKSLPKKQPTRSKTFTKLNKNKSPYRIINKKHSLAGPILYPNGVNLGSYLRAKSYSKKQIKMNNTTDLSNLLSKQIYSKNQY